MSAFSSLELGWCRANSCSSSSFSCSMLLLMRSRRIFSTTGLRSCGRRGVGGGRAQGPGTWLHGDLDALRTYSVLLLGAEQLHGHGAGGHAGVGKCGAGVPVAPRVSQLLYRRRRRAGAWGPGAAAVPTLGGQWQRGPHKGASPLAHAKLPVNWRGHNGRSPRSRWAAPHNVRAVGTRLPSLASQGLVLGAPRLNMLPFPRPRLGGWAGRSPCLPLPATPHGCWQGPADQIRASFGFLD